MLMKVSASELPWLGRRLAQGEEFEAPDAQASRLFGRGQAQPLDVIVPAEALTDETDRGQPFKAGDRLEIPAADYLERLSNGRVAPWAETSSWVPPTEGVPLAEAFRLAVTDAPQLVAIREVERAVGSGSLPQRVLCIKELSSSTYQPVLGSEPTDPGPPPVGFLFGPPASGAEAFHEYWGRSYAYEARDQNRPVRIRIYRERQLGIKFLAALQNGHWAAAGFRPTNPKRTLEKIAAAWWSDPDLVIDCGERSELRPADASGPPGGHYRGIIVKPTRSRAPKASTGAASRPNFDAELKEFIDKRYGSAEMCTEDRDWTAAEHHFGCRITRPEIRKARKHLPEEVHQRGRRRTIRRA
jgi:hypothetical protein